MSDGPLGSPLAAAWVAWVAENALRGAPAADLCAGLVAGGLDAARAEREVAAVLGSPILAGARRLVARSAGIEQVCRLARTRDAGPVPEVAAGALDVDQLHRDFWRPNRPVVVRGAAAGWPARRWTFADLAARFGHVEVSFLVGRERPAGSPPWWRDRDECVARTTVAAVVARCLGAPSDDGYADGRTDWLAEPGLAPLAADLGTMPGLAADPFARLWVGPAGTLTPLHHDQSTGWLVQLVGRKRLWFASPLEPALLTTAVGLFNRCDPRAVTTSSAQEDAELAEVAWREVTLEPGDAVLVTVGWWHQVEALTPSISVSMGGFVWPNAVPWYLPARR